MCLNKKVIAGVALAAVAVYLIAPNLIGAALPLLIIAICPLSMIVMMKAMSGQSDKADSPPAAGSDTEIDAELARLRSEVAELRATRSPSETFPSTPPADRH